jgi:hypothetical protein
MGEVPDPLAGAARRAADGLLEEAAAEARAAAKDELRRRLVDAILDEALRAPRAVVTAAGADGCDHPGVYVYAFTRGDAERTRGLPGVGGRPTYPVVVSDVVAVVGDIAGRRHGWGTDTRGQPDLALLTPQLTDHERLLEQLLELGPVVPMRFGSLFPSAAAVGEAVDAHREAIVESLDRVEGRVEWGLTVTWSPPPAPHPAGETAPAGGAPGRAYLGRRGQQAARAGAEAETGATIGAAVHDALHPLAAASVVHPLPGRPASDGRRAVLRASYLVGRDATDRFRSAIVAALDAAPYDLGGDLTGPWPPYSFCSLRLGEAAA